MGQKPTQLQRDCLWWPDRGSGGCEDGGTRYPAGHLPSGTENPCMSASVPAPGILTKLLTSPGGPRGQPGASVPDLTLHDRPGAASFVRAVGSPVPHGPRGLGQGAESRHPTVDRVLLPDPPHPSKTPPPHPPHPRKRPISRHFSSWLFFPSACAGACGVKFANPRGFAASILPKRGTIREPRARNAGGQHLRQGLREGCGPRQMSRADPAPPRAPQRKQKNPTNLALKPCQPAAGLPGCCSPFTCFME